MSTAVLQGPALQSIGQQFMQSVATIQNYASWIEGQQATGVAQADSVLSTCKQHAMQWYNEIYPSYLNLPSQITTAGIQIDNNLSLLIQLAGQLESTDTPAIRQSISQYSTSLLNTLQGLETEISGVGTSLSQFKDEMNADVPQLGQALMALNQNLAAQYQRLNQLQGQLHSLQSASCPSSSAISSCQQLIQSVQSQIASLQPAIVVFQNACNQCGQVVNSAIYLTSFWTGINVGLEQVIQGLQNIQNSPAAILDLELQQNEANWNNLKSELEQINQQIQTNKYL